MSARPDLSDLSPLTCVLVTPAGTPGEPPVLEICQGARMEHQRRQGREDREHLPVEQEQGAGEETLRRARFYADEAAEALAPFAQGPLRRALVETTEFATTRGF